MLRLDTFSKLPWEKKQDGRYWTHITLGEVGSQLRYYSRRADGQIVERVETVTEEGLFNDDSVKSLPGLPIILVHPKQKTYNLNREGHRVGTILSTVGREDSKLIAEAIVDDWRGVELIDKLLKDGKSPEASSGYHLKDLLRREDGILEQIRGIYDHVAAPLQPGTARGGSNILMRFDSNDAVSDRLYFDLGGNRKNVKDLIVRLDSKDIIIKEASPEVEEAIEFYRKRCDTLTSDLEGVEERLEEVQKERDGLKLRVDEAEKAPDVSAEIKLRMDAWAEVETIAPSVKPDYALPYVGIIKQGIKAIKPELNLDSMDEATIKGIWQGIKIAGIRQDSRDRDRQPPRDRNTDSYLRQQRQDSIGGDDKGENKAALAYRTAYKTNRRQR